MITKKNDVIASVCKVMSSELEAQVEEESRAAWAKTNEEIKSDTVSADSENTDETADTAEDSTEDASNVEASNADNSDADTQSNDSTDAPVDFD